MEKNTDLLFFYAHPSQVPTTYLLGTSHSDLEKMKKKGPHEKNLRREQIM